MLAFRVQRCHHLLICSRRTPVRHPHFLLPSKDSVDLWEGGDLFGAQSNQQPGWFLRRTKRRPTAKKKGEDEKVEKKKAGWCTTYVDRESEFVVRRTIPFKIAV